MKKRKWIVVPITLALIGVLSVAAVYANERTGFFSRSKTAGSEAWDKLTDAQKAEIYAAQAAVDKANQALLDKAAEYGLVDPEDAAEMKDAMDERSAQMQEEGAMPFFNWGWRVVKPDEFNLPDVKLPEDWKNRGELTEEEKEALITQMEESLQKAVEEGKMTQEQADAMLERLKGLEERVRDFKFEMPELPFKREAPAKNTSVKGL